MNNTSNESGYNSDMENNSNILNIQDENININFDTDELFNDVNNENDIIDLGIEEIKL